MKFLLRRQPFCLLTADVKMFLLLFRIFMSILDEYLGEIRVFRSINQKSSPVRRWRSGVLMELLCQSCENLKLLIWFEIHSFKKTLKIKVLSNFYGKISPAKIRFNLDSVMTSFSLRHLKFNPKCSNSVWPLGGSRNNI